jgi:hypothetical protein
MNCPYALELASVFEDLEVKIETVTCGHRVGRIQCVLIVSMSVVVFVGGETVEKPRRAQQMWCT